MGYYYDDYIGSRFEDTAVIILLVVGIVMLFALAIGLVLYLLKAFGLYKMAKTLGIKNAGLAFVPVVGDYMLGKVAEAPIDGKKPMRFGLILLLLNIASFVLGSAFTFYTVVMDIISEMESISTGMTAGTGFAGYMVGYLATLGVSIVYAVFYYMALYRIFKVFAPDYTVAFLLLSMFISGAVNVLFFIIRNKPARLNTQAQMAPPVGTPGYNPAYGEGNYNPYGYNQSNYTPSGDWNYQRSENAEKQTIAASEASREEFSETKENDTSAAPENTDGENL